MPVKKYFVLLILMIAMLFVCILVVASIEIKPKIISFCDSEYKLKVELYYDEKEEKYYLFLPSHTSKDKIQVQHKKSEKVIFSVNGTEFDNLSELPFSTDIDVNVQNNVTKCDFTMQILQCKNLPTVYIETRTGTMKTVDSSKDNSEETAVVIINSDGVLQHRGRAKISSAGNTTFFASKKPYNLKFNEDVELFGIAKTKQWRLMANVSDDSALRNYICYNIANEIEINYTSTMEYISVFLNGQYNGVYTICTKNKYESDKENIFSIFETKHANGNPYAYIVSCNENRKMVESKVEAFENALFKMKSYKDVETCIDVVSFAKKFLLEEYVANCDNNKSQYFSINESGKIEAVCAWDYDLSLGATYGTHVDMPYNSTVIRNLWYASLFEFPQFRQLVIQLSEEYEDIFNQRVFDLLSKACLILDNDWNINCLRWKNISQFEETKLKCKPELTTLYDHEKYIKTFLKNRFSFLTDIWSNETDFCSVTFLELDGCGVVANYKKNQYLDKDELPDGIVLTYEMSNGNISWYTKEGKSIFDVDIISEDMIFFEKQESDNTTDRLPVDNDISKKTWVRTVEKVLKWSFENFGIVNTFLIFVFEIMFLIVTIVNMRNRVRRKDLKK